MMNGEIKSPEKLTYQNIGNWVSFFDGQSADEPETLGRILSYRNDTKKARIVITKIDDETNKWKGEPSKEIAYEQLTIIPRP